MRNSYDPLGRLIAASYDSGKSYSYSYDAVGNRLSQTTPDGTDTYTYLANNQLQSVNDVYYSYDQYGNLRYDGSKNYSYDSADRLVYAYDISTYNVYTYEYDGLGDLMKGYTMNYPTQKSSTTYYTQDIAGGLSQVLSDGENLYTYGYNRIAQVNDDTMGYFLDDILGSVRQVVDSDGEIVLGREYSPYGETISSTGDFDTDFGYTGELTDGTRLVNLRARFYDPGIGRFLTRDTWAGDYNMPSTLVKWLYANSNPMRYTDPSGENAVMAIFKKGDPYTSDIKPNGEPGETKTYYSPGWGFTERTIVESALDDVAHAYARALKYELRRLLREEHCSDYDILLNEIESKSASEIFLTVHGGQITFIRLAETTQQANRDPEARYWGYTPSSRKILVYSNATEANVSNNPRFIVHEVGHAFENAMVETIGYKAGRDGLPVNLITRDTSAFSEEKYAGFYGGQLSWQYSPYVTNGEIFADMFIGWVYNKWEVGTNNLLTVTAQKRAGYMNQHMPGWILDIVFRR